MLVPAGQEKRSLSLWPLEEPRVSSSQVTCSAKLAVRQNDQGCAPGYESNNTPAQPRVTRFQQDCRGQHMMEGVVSIFIYCELSRARIKQRRYAFGFFSLMIVLPSTTRFTSLSCRIRDTSCDQPPTPFTFAKLILYNTLASPISLRITSRWQWLRADPLVFSDRILDRKQEFQQVNNRQSRNAGSLELFGATSRLHQLPSVGSRLLAFYFRKSWQESFRVK